MRMKPGTLVVFEGLDKTGKSTQMERFERAVHAPQLGESLISPAPMFTHQPSGATGIGPQIYELTESIDWRKANPLTRQYLHLAAHAEHYLHDIEPALQERAVWMDRCWWSTVAYGWRGDVPSYFHGLEDYISWAQIPARDIRPTVVFLFLEQYGIETHAGADQRTRKNYLKLARRNHEQVVKVPRLTRGETTAFISGELHKRGLLTIKENKS